MLSLTLSGFFFTRTDFVILKPVFKVGLSLSFYAYPPDCFCNHGGVPLSFSLFFLSLSFHSLLRSTFGKHGKDRNPPLTVGGTKRDANNQSNRLKLAYFTLETDSPIQPGQGEKPSSAGPWKTQQGKRPEDHEKDRMGKYAQYFKDNEILPIPEIIEKFEPRILSLVVFNLKTRRLVGQK